MKKQWRLVAAIGFVGVALAGQAWAVDPFENGTLGGDDGAASRVAIGHGGSQVHDLDQNGGGDDQDWVVVPTVAGHSYEARVSNTAVWFNWGACPECANFERVDQNGAILTEDVATVNEGDGSNEEAYDRSVRWIATASTVDEYVRITGSSQMPEGPADVYTLRFWDTTYSIPRWNNVNGQVTVFLINNQVQAAVTGNIYFYSPTGTLLHTQPFTVNEHQLFVFSTGTVPALQNTSGHAYVAHNGGYGGLAGKAVALEPATGFAFDTPMAPIPQ